MTQETIIHVLFGTETGNAEECALDVGRLIREQGFLCQVTDLDDFSPPDIAKEKLVVLVTSTYGNGGPPANAADLMDWLIDTQESLGGVSYAVCGLGDTAYPNFCQAAKDFDELLEQRGASRILPIQENCSDYEESIGAFHKSLLDWLNKNGQALQLATQ